MDNNENHIHFHFGNDNYKVKPPPRPRLPTLFVAANPNPYVSTNSILYSKDGNTWNNLVTGGMSNVNSIAYGSNMWVAAGYDYDVKLKYSKNGSNWSNVPTPNLLNASKIVFVPKNLTYPLLVSSMWVTCGFSAGGSTSARNSIQFSRNGSDGWSGIQTGGFRKIGAPTSLTNDISYGKGVFVAVGESDFPNSSIQYSVNASNWTGVNEGGFTSSIGLSVAYGSNMWVATGIADSKVSSIQYSKDGSNWSTIVTGGFLKNPYEGEYTYSSVAYGNGLWVACGYAENLNETVQYSTDGSNWCNASGIISPPRSISYNTRIGGTTKVPAISKYWIAHNNYVVQYSSNGRVWYTKKPTEFSCSVAR
jgi:hypothetical protein